MLLIHDDRAADRIEDERERGVLRPGVLAGSESVIPLRSRQGVLVRPSDPGAALQAGSELSGAATVASREVSDEAERRAARRRWADLIRRIYEVDPLVCSNCGGPMKIVAFTTDRKAIRAILASMRKSVEGSREQARAAQMGIFSPTVEVYRRTFELRARPRGSAARGRRSRSWRGGRGI